MNNNDILRRLRYVFDFSDSQMTSTFASGGSEVEWVQICDWLRREEDPQYQECGDEQLATFLNGLIVDRRGKRDGRQPVPEKSLNNNIILRKLKIALDFKSEDILDTLRLARFPIGKSELSSFFRNPGHRNYMLCRDQVLRRFLNGLQVKYRGTSSSEQQPR